MKCPGEAYKDKALNFRIKSILKSQEPNRKCQLSLKQTILTFTYNVLLAWLPQAKPS